ncbi:MAG: hypothetical protein AAGM38_17905 [Pseudomonadota bacterium]
MRRILRTGDDVSAVEDASLWSLHLGSIEFGWIGFVDDFRIDEEKLLYYELGQLFDHENFPDAGNYSTKGRSGMPLHDLMKTMGLAIVSRQLMLMLKSFNLHTVEFKPLPLFDNDDRHKAPLDYYIVFFREQEAQFDASNSSGFDDLGPFISSHHEHEFAFVSRHFPKDEVWKAERLKNIVCFTGGFAKDFMSLSLPDLCLRECLITTASE